LKPTRASQGTRRRVGQPGCRSVCRQAGQAER
jgi:hypothetical protein